MKQLILLAAVAGTVSSACATTGALRAEQTPGAWIALNRSPVHLGDQNYNGQSFNQARVESHSWCTVVRVPRGTNVSIRIDGLRNTERPTNQIRIDGESSMLPMLLAQSTYTSSLGTQMASTWNARFEAGPHEICIVAGRSPENPTDIDDFEFAAILMRADDIAPIEIENRVISNHVEVRGTTEVAQHTPFAWGH